VQEDRPRGTPPGTIQIDPDQGFGPHMTEAFLNLYGEDSVFVTATVDSLTWRFVGVLVRAEKLPSDFEAVQYGSPAMRQALEVLLKALGARGLDNPSTTLMRSAVGHEQPQAFQATASLLLGDSIVANWLGLMEQEDYAGATALLAVH
jgi:hypothetical protein